MGQYYLAVILGDLSHLNFLKKEYVRCWLSPYSYGNGVKLMEHSYVNNRFISAFEYLISPDGPFYMSRVVWAGDYAENEPNSNENLHKMLCEKDEKLEKPVAYDTTTYRYIVNHTKMQYVDKEALYIHPLPLLIAEGNGMGGGDYKGRNKHLCGTWARDIISVEYTKPDEFSELFCDFGE